MAKDNSITNCKNCRLSFKKKRADNIFCSKQCRDKDSYINNREKNIAAATNRLADPINRMAHNKSQLKWAHSNFKKRKNAMLKNRYNISLSDYESMYEKQNGKCAICLIDSNSLHVDHCHKTNKIRGLLCGNCNKALGLLKDNTDNFLRAMDYLNEKKEETEV